MRYCLEYPFRMTRKSNLVFTLNFVYVIKINTLKQMLRLDLSLDYIDEQIFNLFGHQEKV